MKFAVPQVLRDSGVLLCLSLCLSPYLCVPVSMAPFISKMAAIFSGTHAEETAVSKEQRLFLLVCHFLLGRKSIPRRPQQICPQDAAASLSHTPFPGTREATVLLPSVRRCLCYKGAGIRCLQGPRDHFGSLKASSGASMGSKPNIWELIT